jgi:hypothetical protein
MAANGISTLTLKRTRQHTGRETLLLFLNYLLGIMLQVTQVHWLTMQTAEGLLLAGHGLRKWLKKNIL